MLNNRHDFIAAQYGEFYDENLEGEEGWKLIQYAIANSNEIFLRYSFRNGLFPDFFTKKDGERIDELLQILN